MRSVRIRTPARLHFGLFADGRGPRKFGGVGLAIDKPGFELTVQFDERDHIYSWIDPSLKPRIEKLLARLRDRFDVPPVRIDVEDFIPHHVGLGSGTQLALAVGEAVATLLNLPIEIQELASVLGRGRRSGIGFHAFSWHFDGTLFIDDGKSSDERIATMAALRLLPRSWRTVLMRPELPAGTHGDEEMSAFQDRIRIPAETTERLRTIALSRIVPAIDAEDYDAFGNAVYEFNRLSGECFAPVQGGVYSHPRLGEIVADARSLGCLAVGQSSWGPTLFGILPTEEAANMFLAGIEELHPDLETSTTTLPEPTCRLAFSPGAQLLVSVRTLEEAQWIDGADVIDLKDPNRGPLGALDAPTTQAVFAWHKSRQRRMQGNVSLSVALGDLAEVDENRARAVKADVAEWKAHYWKVGFAGERGRHDWTDRFFLLGRTCFGENNAAQDLIPVAYADDENADAPNWRDIVDRICRKRREWSLFLVDTFSKQTNFWDALGGKEGVRELFDVCEKERIHLALAGSLKIDDVDRLADEIGKLPHVIAVRGAACKDGVRTNPIDRARVAKLRRRIIAAELRLDRRGPPRGCR